MKKIQRKMGTWKMVRESLDPQYADKPENQYGEKWQRVTGTYLNSVIDGIMRDIRIDPSDEGMMIERISIGDLHICEDGHLVLEVFGGCEWWRLHWCGEQLAILPLPCEEVSGQAA